MVGNEPRLRRADALHIRVVGQVIGETIRVQLQVVPEHLRGELPPVLGVAGPLAFEHHGVARPGKHLAGEGDESAFRRPEPPGGERRTGVEDRLYGSTEGNPPFRRRRFSHVHHLA